MSATEEALVQGSQRRKSFRSLSAMKSFIDPHRGIVVGAVAALLVTATVALSLPAAFGNIVDGFSGTAGQGHDRYFAIVILAIGVLSIGSAARNYLTRLLGELIARDIRKAVFSRMIWMSPSFFERNRTGEILSRLTADTTVIQLFVGNAMSMAMRHSVMFCGGLILLFFTSPKLMGLALIVVPLVMGPIIAVGRWVRSNAADSQEWLAAASANASEVLSATETIQAFSAEAHAKAKFNDITGGALAAAHKMVKSHALMNAIVVSLVFLGMIAVIWVGLQEVQADRITLGSLVQFALYSVIVATSLAAFSDVWGEVQRAAGAADRIVTLLEAKDEISDPVQPKLLPEPVRGAVAFENVIFSYPKRPEARALDVSLAVPAGQTVALVGASGAGKSTVLQLLLRFYDPQWGRITIDGTDIKDLKQDTLRKHIAIVQQDAMVFAASVRENIRFGRPGATDAEVEAAARAAAAHGFICDFPQGYDTFIGERGTLLSGGQKQRIAIARAILKDAPILLLDEATSALDSESERAIQEAVKDMSKGRTTLVVAHRLATVKSADCIFVFEQGQIVAQGTHADLIAEGGLYARYSELQLI